MNRISLLAVAMCSLTFAACGGGDDGGKDGVTLPDAKTNPGADAPLAPDAPPAAVMGLGQRCDPMAPACPANASTCLPTSATAGYCSPLCINDASGTTNAMGSFTVGGPGGLTPPPNDSACTAAYTQTVGTAKCKFIISANPMPANNMFMPNTAYTMIKGVCGIDCASQADCPTGLTCNTTAGACVAM